MSSANAKSSNADRGVQEDLGQLRDDLAQLKTDVASMATEAYGMARERVAGAVEDVRRRGTEAAEAIEGHVQENPWRSVGIAFGVGVLIGLVIRGR